MERISSLFLTGYGQTMAPKPRFVFKIISTFSGQNPNFMHLLKKP